MEQLKISLAQIANVTGECLPVIYNAINAGHLKTFLVGRRRFARPESVRAWIDLLEAKSNAGAPVTYRARSGERGGGMRWPADMTAAARAGGGRKGRQGNHHRIGDYSLYRNAQVSQ